MIRSRYYVMLFGSIPPVLFGVISGYLMTARVIHTSLIETCTAAGMFCAVWALIVALPWEVWFKKALKSIKKRPA